MMTMNNLFHYSSRYTNIEDVHFHIPYVIVLVNGRNLSGNGIRGAIPSPLGTITSLQVL